MLLRTLDTFLRRYHLLTDDARALQAASQELDRQRAQDSLRKNLEKRPARDELVERKFLCLARTRFYLGIYIDTLD